MKKPWLPWVCRSLWNASASAACGKSVWLALAPRRSPASKRHRRPQYTCCPLPTAAQGYPDPKANIHPLQIRAAAAAPAAASRAGRRRNQNALGEAGTGSAIAARAGLGCGNAQPPPAFPSAYGRPGRADDAVIDANGAEPYRPSAASIHGAVAFQIEQLVIGP